MKNYEAHKKKLKKSLVDKSKAKAESLEIKEKYENALIESEERFSLMADTAPIMIWISGADRQLFYFNKMWLDFTGRSILDELGNGWLESLHPDDVDSCLKIYNAAYKGKKNFEMEFRLKRYDSKYRWIFTRGVPRFLPDDYFAGFLGTAIDITDRKLAENALRMSEEKYRSVVQSVREVIFTTDDAGVFTFLNPFWHDLTGYDIKSGVGKPLFSYFHPEDKKICIDQFISIIYKKKPYTLFEARMKTKEGFYKWIEVNARITLDEKSNIIGTSGTLSNIHEKKLVNEELIKAKERAEESDRLKSAFLAQVSHEIRTPTNIILGYNSLIKEKLQNISGLNLTREFDTIDASSRRLLRTIDLILNMSMVQSGTYEIMNEKFDLKKMLNELILEFKPLADEKEINLSYRNSCKNNFIYADKYTLTQAFQNIIDNAIKFTVKGYVKVISEETGEGIAVKITDTGIGISKEYLPKLFQPFTQEEVGYSRKFDGNGLGLALTKKYLEINKAVIAVDSIKGKGTTFTILMNRNNSKEAK